MSGSFHWSDEGPCFSLEPGRHPITGSWIDVPDDLLAEYKAALAELQRVEDKLDGLHRYPERQT